MSAAVHRDEERPERDLERAEERRWQAAEEAEHAQRESARPSRRERPVPPIAGIREGQQRLHHLMAAAHNLHAAGLHELAERVRKEAEGLQRRLQERESSGPVGGSRPSPRLHGPAESGPGHGKGGVPGRIAELEEQVRALRNAVEELRRQRPEERKN